MIKGWHAASAASGGVPIRTLRRLVAEGALVGRKGSGGIWEFSSIDLAAFAATSGKPIAGAIGNAPAAAPAAVAAVTAQPPAAATTPTGQPASAPWLLAAAVRRDVGAAVAAVEDTDDDDNETYDRSASPPFWAAATNAPWPTESRVPIGVDPVTRVILYAPPSQPAANSAQQHIVLQLQVAELQRQLEATRAEAQQARATAAYYNGRYRHVRVRQLADLVANEAIAAGERPEVSQVAATAAANAVGALDDAALCNDQWALHVARGWGVAAGRWAAAQMQAARQHERSYVVDDLDVARRRSRNRGARTRW